MEMYGAIFRKDAEGDGVDCVVYHVDGKLKMYNSQNKFA